jgi:hypothetical protein
MERTLRETYTVATDDVTGRVVIVTNGQKVIGALTREASVAFAQDIIDWIPPMMRPVEKDPAIS